MREEYKQFLDDASAVEAAFKSALTHSDNAPFAHDAELVEKMARVGAFEFAKDDLIIACRHRIKHDAELLEKNNKKISNVGIDLIDDFYHERADRAKAEIKDEIEELKYIESLENVSENLQGEYWERATSNFQKAVYDWLEFLDMPNSALRKFKADIKLMRSSLCGWLGFVSVDRKKNLFRRLVSIARGLAPAVKDETIKPAKKIGEKCRDEELNRQAKGLIFKWSPADRAFSTKLVKDRVYLSEKQFEFAKIVLCGACDAEGWVSIPEGVRKPTNLSGCSKDFFSYIHNDGRGRYRLMSERAKSCRGGKRDRAGRHPKKYASATD